MYLNKGFDKKSQKYTSCKRGFAEDCLEEWENCADNLSNNLVLHEISRLIFVQFYCKRNQKTIRNSCRSNLWSISMLMLWNIEIEFLKKKPGDKVFWVSLKFPRCKWDQRSANFSSFSSIEVLSCCSCLILYFHD